MDEISRLHIGIDLGGTKIAGILLDQQRHPLAHARVATPQGDYQGTLDAVAGLVEALERSSLVENPALTPLIESCVAKGIPVGIGTPGARLPGTGLMSSCNSVCLNGKPLREDLAACLNRPVQLANDADCLALSEWHHYQAMGKSGPCKPGDTMFGVILGTGVGGGWVHEGHLLAGPNGLAGEWGHTPLPYFDCDSGLPNPCFELESKLATRHCYCGRKNCIETFLSGPGLQKIHHELWQQEASPEQLANTWASAWSEHGIEPGWPRGLLGEPMKQGTEQLLELHQSRQSKQQAKQQLASLSLYLDLLARSLAQVVNVIDPQAIVLGGGLSNMACLYRELPQRLAPYLFSRDRCETKILPPLGGATSGVFGAAALVGGWSLR